MKNYIYTLTYADESQTKTNVAQANITSAEKTVIRYSPRNPLKVELKVEVAGEMIEVKRLKAGWGMWINRRLDLKDSRKTLIKAIKKAEENET